MRDPHVVHLVPSRFGPHGVMGGAERYAEELARAMSRRVRTTLVAFGPEERRVRNGELETWTLGRTHYVRGEPHNPISPHLFTALKPATVVHCHQRHVVASSAAAAFCRLTGRHVFVTDLGGGGWDVSAYVRTDAWFHGHLHISEYSRRVFGHERHPKAHVILGGVDTARFCPDPQVRRRPVVLYVGRILPHKGIDDLIQALPPDIVLVIMGSAPDERYLNDLRSLAAGKPVTFCHNADDERLVGAYREALCVVLPSVYRTMYGRTTNVPELLGQTLLEAMACGTAVIGTNVASLPEVIDAGVTGLLVPPNNPPALRQAIMRLRDAPAEALRMGAAGRKRVEARFIWDAVVERCLEIYRIGRRRVGCG
jgi:glycosyltransferase involved in cell wall biosynthesis